MSLRLSALAVPLILLASLSHAQPLWQADPAGAAAGLPLPGNAVGALAVRVPAAGLSGLVQGSTLSLDLPGEGTLDYTVESVTRFPNGDLGVRGVMNQAPAGSHFIISMTMGQSDLLATVYSPQGRTLLSARRSGDAWLGYVYKEMALQKLPPDAGAAVRGQRDDAISNSDVAITQTLSEEYVTIGTTVQVAVEVTNNSSATINNQNLVVNFILDAADFIDATTGCVAKDVQYSNGVFKELHCPVNNLAPGGKFNISYQARMTARGLLPR